MLPDGGGSLPENPAEQLQPIGGRGGRSNRVSPITMIDPAIIGSIADRPRSRASDSGEGRGSEPPPGPCGPGSGGSDGVPGGSSVAPVGVDGNALPDSVVVGAVLLGCRGLPEGVGVAERGGATDVRVGPPLGLGLGLGLFDGSVEGSSGDGDVGGGATVGSSVGGGTGGAWIGGDGTGGGASIGGEGRGGASIGGGTGGASIGGGGTGRG